MADLIGADVASVKMFRWTGETTTLNSSFSVSSVDTLPRGVDWDGTDLIWSGSEGGKGYRSTVFTLTIQDSYSTGDVSNTRGMSWDASNAMDHQRSIGDKWRLRTGFTASVTSSFTKANQPLGGSWDASAADILTVDNVDDKLRQHDGFTATITTSFASTSATTGITENASDEFIVNISAGNDKVQKRNVFTSTVTSSWSPAEGTNRSDVTWDGRFAAAPSTVVSDALGMGIIPFAR